MTAKDHPMPIEDAIHEFLRSRQAMACTQHTMRSYHDHLIRQLLRWLLSRDVVHLEDLTTQQLTEYLVWCRDRGVSATTLTTIRRHFGVFINWCGAAGYLPPDMIKAVPKPRVRQYIRRTHTDEEILKLFATAGDHRLFHPFDGQELVATMMLLLDTGLRSGEIIGLDVDDIDGDLIKVRGKGDKDRYVMISERTKVALREYLKLRHPVLPGQPLLINRGYGVNYSARGGRLSVAGLYQRMRRLGQAAGVETSIHRWRHTFAALAVRNGANLKTLQLFLGHASLLTTDNYLRGFGFQDAAREHRVFSPVAAMFQH